MLVMSPEVYEGIVRVTTDPPYCDDCDTVIEVGDRYEQIGTPRRLRCSACEANGANYVRMH